MKSHHLIRALALITLVPLTSLQARSPKEALKSVATHASMAMGLESTSITVVNKTDYKPLATARFKFVGKIGNTKVHPTGETAKAMAPDAEVTLVARDAVDEYREKVSDKFSEKGKLKRVQPVVLKVGHSKKRIERHGKKGHPTRFIVTLKNAPFEKYRIETEEEYETRLENKRLKHDTRVHKKD